jgi:hypothetical protein
MPTERSYLTGMVKKAIFSTFVLLGLSLSSRSFLPFAIESTLLNEQKHLVVDHRDNEVSRYVLTQLLLDAIDSTDCIAYHDTQACTDDKAGKPRPPGNMTSRLTGFETRCK